MKFDTGPLLDAIDRYIAKADNDLEDALTAEGYPAAKKAVEMAGKLEDAIDDALDADSLEFLERVQEASGVEDFLADVWPEIKDADDLRKALYEIFRERFDEMLKGFTYEWMLSENPLIAGIDEEITKPAEAFITGWSDELARIMHLNTKDAMERMLLKAQDEEWSIDKLAEAIGDSGIRNHGYRSRRVALTEMLRVESYAQQEGMVQNPLAYKKKWRHVMSEHPRENHMATPSYLDNDIPAMIEDAFLNDETIQGISDLEYEIIDGDSLVIQFAVSTIFGDANFEGVINDG